MLSRTNGWLVAALVSMAMIGACGGAGQIEDTPEKRMEIARRIVKLEIESGDLDDRLDRGADLAQAYSLDTLRIELGRELTDQELERVRQIMRSVLAEFLTYEIWTEVLTEVYTKHFTAGELDQIWKFLESPAGTKLVKLSGEFSNDIDTRTDELLEGKLEAFVNRVDEELGKAFPELQEGDS